MTTYIGISGAIGAGKSTLAEQLKSLLPGKVEVIPFARDIKYLASLEMLNNATDRSLLYWLSVGATEGQAVKATAMLMNAFHRWPSQPGVKNRQLMQYIGHEIGRETISPDIWIKRTRAYGRECDYVIADDVRYDNEARAVDYHIRIDISNQDDYHQNIAEYDARYLHADHASEHSLTAPAHWVVPCRFARVDAVMIARYIKAQTHATPIN